MNVKIKAGSCVHLNKNKTQDINEAERRRKRSKLAESFGQSKNVKIVLTETLWWKIDLYVFCRNSVRYLGESIDIDRLISF